MATFWLAVQAAEVYYVRHSRQELLWVFIRPVG